MSAQSSFFEKGILLNKPCQASQSWHQLSFFEKGILVQYNLLNEWTLEGASWNMHIYAKQVFVKTTERKKKEVVRLITRRKSKWVVKSPASSFLVLFLILPTAYANLSKILGTELKNFLIHWSKQLIIIYY